VLEQHVVQIDGAPIYFWVRNPHAHQTVLFVHGFRGEHGGLIDIDQLNNDFRVIMLDLPGFGLSDPMAKSHTIANYADCLHQFLAELQINKVHLVGHSYGSSIAIIFASQHPESLHTLILAMPAIPRYSISRALVDLQLNISQHLPHKLQQLWLYAPIVDAIGYLMLSHAPLSKKKLAIFRQKLKYPPHTDPRVIIQALRSFNHTNFFAYARQITTPTLIIGGDKDFIATVKSVKLLAKAIPNSQLIILKGQGHVVNHDNPKLLSEPIAQFIMKTSANHADIYPNPSSGRALNT
jgi:pimeloyl-ACP methyl ester carboxylesterase